MCQICWRLLSIWNPYYPLTISHLYFWTKRLGGKEHKEQLSHVVSLLSNSPGFFLDDFQVVCQSARFFFSEWPFTSPLSSQHHPPSLRATIAASMECWMPWMTTVEWWNAPSMGTVTSCWKTCPLAERDGGGRWPNRIQYRYTIWLFNVAMGNDPFIDGLPIKNGDFPPWLC